MKIAIHGYRGRMGAVLRSYATVPPFEEVHLFDIRRDVDWDYISEKRCVVIDFSSPKATKPLLSRCVEEELPVVIGTTGHNEKELDAIKQASLNIPIVKATNFSTGVNVLFWLTCKAAEILGPEFDSEIVEMHHRLKKDAPSGTAVTLGKIIAEAYTHGTDTYCYGRKGNIGARPNLQIGIHAVRGGTVFGKHKGMFLGDNEEVVLSHEAGSRECFAKGALRAVTWVASDGCGAVRAPGLYDMMDVLGLK